jgi:predicted transcriptional regulator
MINKYIMLYLLSGTKGGITRAKIISTLKKTPLNHNQLSEILGLDYKTIQHHIRILVENNIIFSVNKGKYGAMYFITPEMEDNWDIFKSIWKKSG